MPAFIKSEKDEKVWSRAKSIVHKNYPDMSETDEDFWKVTNSIYHRIKGSGVHKVAGDKPSVLQRLLAPLRARRSRINPANISGLPEGGSKGLHPMSTYFNFADRALLDPDAKKWYYKEALPKERGAAVWDGKYKCNAFVQQAAAAAFGNKNILQHPKLGRTFLANEIHNGILSKKPFDVGGGYVIHPITAEEAALLPGSIVTSGVYNGNATGHIGITPGFGERATISAASADNAKGVVKNDWGWRKGATHGYGMIVPASEKDVTAYKRRMLDFARKGQGNFSPKAQETRRAYFRSSK